jgi:cell division protein FtsL
MTGESFEYAIRKDVRNNPIVREVDRDRHREMWRSVGLGSFLVAALIFFVWRQVELLQHGYEVSELRDQRIAQEKVNDSLRVTVETLKAPSRIEDLATRKLRMIIPAPEDQGAIELVIVDEGPDSSVLARR